MSQPRGPLPPSSPDLPPNQSEPAYQVGQVVNGHVWTGTQWVPQTQAGAVGPPPPVAQPDEGPVGPATKPKKPIYKRWWAWAVAAVALLLIIIVAVNGGGGDQVATPEASAPPTSPISRASIPK